ncbi:hypothetical protein [uncultured Tateyamaria sp.]|uniref:pectate lyase family protein n=1 Tax=uncultured Tateyamaria sp. TaxID=455651 RepID=UPI00260B461A|nr:hypothetical protein [uncultured Tateyamaria sp.]
MAMMRISGARHGLTGGLALSLALCAPVGAAGKGAFPGADGYGVQAVGWKGGTIVAVTTLADAGPGSLRACAQDLGSRPRICIFEVAGTIDLRGPIMVGSNVYVAGQTAPGDGVQLRIIGGGHGPLIVKNAHDVVIRHLKLRPGPSRAPSPTVDAITVENARHVMLDNLSMSFATDETFNIHVSNSTASDITLSDSILSLSLDRTNHPKGRHSKGALICSDEGAYNACGRISLLRNLFAHHRDRMPDIKATPIGPIEVINNVFYNPISQFGEVYDLLGDAEVAYVGNVALTGPSTVRKTPEAVQVFEWEDENTVRLMAADNVTGTPTGCRLRRFEVLDAAARGQQVSDGLPMLSVSPMPATKVVDHVLAHAGDRIAGTRDLDPLDARVAADVIACTGQVIDDVTQVGGWPDLATIRDPAQVRDTDGDGLPDTWETGRDDLDPGAANDPWAHDAWTGLSFVESWLAELADDPLD